MKTVLSHGNASDKASAVMFTGLNLLNVGTDSRVTLTLSFAEGL